MSGMKNYWIPAVIISALLAGCSPSEDEAEQVTEEEKMPEAELADGDNRIIELNDVITVQGDPIIQNPENIEANVNLDNRLPVDYEPADLVVPDVRRPYEGIQERSYLREEAADALEQLFYEAELNGHILYANSGFRSFERQYELFKNQQIQSGLDQTLVAQPGFSEHQTGLAMDVSSSSVNFGLTEAFGDTEEGIWIEENAHLFGFIVRYPEGKQEITGYSYEPWHLRYVGTIANEIYEQGVSYEEFIENVKKM